jgi:hypothetical protein
LDNEADPADRDSSTSFLTGPSGPCSRALIRQPIQLYQVGAGSRRAVSFHRSGRGRPHPSKLKHFGLRRQYQVFLRINGVLHYLWREVDQHGVVLDILVQGRRNATAAKRFFKRLLTGLKYKPRRIVTDGLRSSGAAKREVLPDVRHRTSPHIARPGAANARCSPSSRFGMPSGSCRRTA